MKNFSIEPARKSRLTGFSYVMTTKRNEIIILGDAQHWIDYEFN